MESTHMPWPGDDRCILCLERPPSLTEEHVIPASLGGTLSVDFLCKPCNDRLGHSVEADIKNDPRFRLAIDPIADKAPDFARFFGDRLTYVAQGGAGPVHIDVKDGRVQVRARKNPDGSVIQPTDTARTAMTCELRKRGESEESIAATLAAFDSAPEGVRFQASPLHSVIKHPMGKIEHDLSGEFAPRQLFLKIGYEALACRVGNDIYDIEGLDEVRKGINTRDENETPLAYADPSGTYGVESWFLRDRADPVHGIAVGGKGEHAIVRICLFGSWLFDVHFLKVKPRRPFLATSQSLLDGSIDCTEIDAFPLSKESIF